MSEREHSTRGGFGGFAVGLLVLVVASMFLVGGLCALETQARSCGNLSTTVNERGGEPYTEPERIFGGAARIPQWSPDGRILVANIGDRIWGLDTRDNSWHLIPRKRHEGQFSPSVSTTGHVAYLDYDVKNFLFAERVRLHIEIVHIDGRGLHRLSECLHSPTQPVISPDGSRVAWVDRAASDNGVVIVDAGSSGITQQQPNRAKSGFPETRTDSVAANDMGSTEHWMVSGRRISGNSGGETSAAQRVVGSP